VTLTDSQREFIEQNPGAAMITIGDDGMPKAVRVGVAVVDGDLWSSGTADRVRTRRLRDDPRCTVFMFGDDRRALTLETRVSIIDGPDSAEDSVRLFRTMQKRPDGDLLWYGDELDEAAFKQRMLDEQRLIYEFEIEKAYGVD
jgi:hypothetical protein